MMYGYGSGPWMWLGPLSMVLFWALVIAGIFFLMRALWRPAAYYRHPDDALSILERRYANGEITREEYLTMRKDLTGRSR